MRQVRLTNRNLTSLIRRNRGASKMELKKKAFTFIRDHSIQHALDLVLPRSFPNHEKISETFKEFLKANNMRWQGMLSRGGLTQETRAARTQWARAADEYLAELKALLGSNKNYVAFMKGYWDEFAKLAAHFDSELR